MQQQMANMHQQQQNMGNGGLANLHIFRQATPQRRAFTNGTENPATESTLQQNATVEKNDQKAETTTTVDKSQPETTTADKSKADTTLAPAETSILRLQILRFKGKFVGKHRFWSYQVWKLEEVSHETLVLRFWVCVVSILWISSAIAVSMGGSCKICPF